MLALSLVVAFVFGFAGSSLAYVYEGYKFYKCSSCSSTYPSYKWGDRLDNGNSVLKDAWRQAIVDWESRQSKVNFTYSSSNSGILNSYYESGSSYYGWMNVTYNSSKHVTSYYGKLNAGKSGITTTNVARSTANHELGHAMGIDHTSNKSIMDTKRTRTVTYTPKTDDINGINNLY